MAKNAKSISEIVRELAEPLADELGCWVWDVEYVKEGTRKILRITIDSEEGIDINMCEQLHRTIDPLLDEADPIEQAYYLEVSSPGLGRQIKNAFQAELCEGLEVNVKLYAPDEAGRRSFKGTLESYGDGAFTVTVNGEALTMDIKKAAKISLADDE